MHTVWSSGLGGIIAGEASWGIMGMHAALWACLPASPSHNLLGWTVDAHARGLMSATIALYFQHGQLVPALPFEPDRTCTQQSCIAYQLTCCLIPLLQFIGSSHALVSASHDTTARVWDVSREKCMHVLDGHMGRINVVRVDDSATRAITCADDDTARIWDLAKGTCVR